MDELVPILNITWGALLYKTLYLVIVIAAASFVQHVLVRAVRRLLARVEALPQASIITNIVRVAVWVVALVVVLYPVFGVRPTTLFGALGVSSIVISFGLKDTISNIIGGFNLMVSRVVQPGDYVTIAGVTGTVSDLTWRHTVVTNRAGDHVVIPNSVLNTTAVVRQAPTTESNCTVDFTMEAGRDPNAVAADLIATTRDAVGEKIKDGTEPAVYFGSITPYGVKGQLSVYVKDGILFGGVRDAIVRAVANRPYFSTFEEMTTEGDSGTPGAE